MADDVAAGIADEGESAPADSAEPLSKKPRPAQAAQPGSAPAQGNRDPEVFLDDDVDNFGNRADYVSPYQNKGGQGRNRRPGAPAQTGAGAGAPAGGQPRTGGGGQGRSNGPRTGSGGAGGAAGGEKRGGSRNGGSSQPRRDGGGSGGAEDDIGPPGGDAFVAEEEVRPPMASSQ